MLRRWDKQRQASRRLAVMEPVQLVAGLTAAAVMLPRALPSVARVLAQMAAMVRPIV